MEGQSDPDGSAPAGEEGFLSWPYESGVTYCGTFGEPFELSPWKSPILSITLKNKVERESWR